MASVNTSSSLTSLETSLTFLYSGFPTMPSSFFATELMKITFSFWSTAMMPFCIWDITVLSTWFRLFCLNMRSCILAMMALYSAALGSVSGKLSMRASKFPSEKRSRAAITCSTIFSLCITRNSANSATAMVRAYSTACAISARLWPSTLSIPARCLANNKSAPSSYR